MSNPAPPGDALDPGCDAVRMRGVTRRFGAVVANRAVDLCVRRQTIHALVGENGAGKSTLMRILAGELRPDAGEIWVQGELAREPGVAAALRRGVGMVHQHFMLVPALTVAENVVLGREPRRRGLLDRRAAERAVTEIAEAFALPVDPRARVDDLPVAARQKVEILKVLYRGARVLLLDEPTAVLTPREVSGLFAMLRRLVAEGRSVVLITHHLDEVMDVSDHVTVLRQGESVAERPTGDVSARELAHLMVGADLATPPAPVVERDRCAPETVLELRDVVVERGGVRRLDGVSLRVAAGEVLGIAAVQGNGETELLEVVAGLLPLRSGSVWVGAEDVTRHTIRERRGAGLAFIPEDRQERGLVLDLSAAENFALGRQSRFARHWQLDLRRLAAHARDLVARFDVRPPDPTLPARAFSGGNQQKIVVARELAEPPRLLLAGQPTRGVDIGAAAAIHAQIRAAKAAGAAVLLVSADLHELLALSDRIAVLYRGRVATEMPGATASVESLGERMGGLEAA